MGPVSDVGWSIVSEHAMHDVYTTDIGMQIREGREEPVARRQSLQFSITTKGKVKLFPVRLSSP